MICKNCGYKNKSGVHYCQRCGHYIKPKWTLAQEIKSWDFRGLAGVGRRDVNVAPLFTAQKNEIQEKNQPTLSLVDPLPDGRWYCPDCGTLNTSSERFCKNCGKVPGYPLCQKRLVGALPNPLPVAEVPSAAARFANAFPALAVYLMYGPGPDLYERQKEKSRV